MNILVIGQSLEDNINYKGSTSVKPGGIFYSVLGLKSLLKEGDKISLCTSMPEDRAGLFSPVYDDIDKSLFEPAAELPKVYLNITGDSERGECYSFVNKNLSLEGITSFEFYDGILINMITGHDITPGQLEYIRSEFGGIIYFDVHTLARGLEKDGTRKFRTIPGFEKIAKNIDILQVNETEFTCLFEAGSGRETVEKLFALGLKILIVTMGEKGARVYYKIKDEVVSCFVSGVKGKVKNNVGCGDIFGAAFFYSYICKKDVISALKRANGAAGKAATYDNIEKSERFRKDVATGFN